MKKVFAIVLSAVMLTALAGCGAKPSESAAASATQAQTTQAQTTQSETISTDVKSKLDKVLSDEKFRGIVQISKGGEVIYQYAQGNDDNGKALTPDASMPIGSVSKQFCAAAVMLLIEKSKLSVDDTLDRYFPEYKNSKKLTVKHLLNMSSGLTYYLELVDMSAMGTDEYDNVNAIKKAIFSKEPRFEPGDDYEYSNSNYFLLANIVEMASGIAYHKVLRDQFFEPLEMTHTGFTDEISGNPAWSFALSATESTEEGFYTPGITKGAGDVVSNAEDMDRWMRGLSGGKVISSGAYTQMSQEVNPYSTEEYCYGLWHMPFGGVGHVGQIPPHFGAMDYINTERDVCLFALSNSGRGMSYVQEIPQVLLSILFEE